jgi:hypothetical protein
VLAGRTGAAFAAQLGTMQAQEEIDALITFGIPPVEFLVLPRMVALSTDDAAALPLCLPRGTCRRADRRHRDAKLNGHAICAGDAGCLSLTQFNLLFPWPHSHR